MKIKIEIKSWLNGSILFEYETENNTIAKTVSEAIKNSADLRSADLRYADLSSANLRSADLRYADLSYADLSSADLSYADLSSADLSSANLRYANLRYADLSSANLSSAKNVDGDSTDYWWHIHHQTLYEWLVFPIRARINYIKSDKPKDEIELRLKLMKPVLGKIPTTDAGWKRLHKKECGCGYSFTARTIFTKENGLEK